MPTCPFCNKPYPIGSELCPFCKANIKDISDAPIYLCPNCGHHLLPGEDACPVCGLKHGDLSSEALSTLKQQQESLAAKQDSSFPVKDSLDYSKTKLGFIKTKVEALKSLKNPPKFAIPFLYIYSFVSSLFQKVNYKDREVIIPGYYLFSLIKGKWKDSHDAVKNFFSYYSHQHGTHDCPVCGEKILTSQRICPHCFTPLQYFIPGKKCLYCACELSLEWTTCPYCDEEIVPYESDNSASTLTGMRCPACKMKISNTHHNCPYCDEYLGQIEPLITCSHCQEAVRHSHKNCPHCNNPLQQPIHHHSHPLFKFPVKHFFRFQDSDDEQIELGTKPQHPSQVLKPEQSQTKTKIRSNLSMILLIFSLVLFLSVAGVFLYYVITQWDSLFGKETNAAAVQTLTPTDVMHPPTDDTANQLLQGQDPQSEPQGIPMLTERSIQDYNIIPNFIVPEIKDEKLRSTYTMLAQIISSFNPRGLQDFNPVDYLTQQYGMYLIEDEIQDNEIEQASPTQEDEEGIPPVDTLPIDFHFHFSPPVMVNMFTCSREILLEKEGSYYGDVTTRSLSNPDAQMDNASISLDIPTDEQSVIYDPAWELEFRVFELSKGNQTYYSCDGANINTFQSATAHVWMYRLVKIERNNNPNIAFIQGNQQVPQMELSLKEPLQVELHYRLYFMGVDDMVQIWDRDRTEISYNENGAPVRMMGYDYTGNRLFEITYDGAGNIASQTRYENQREKLKWTFEYDGVGHIHKKRIYEEGILKLDQYYYSDTGKIHKLYHHDDQGNLVRVEAYSRDGKLMTIEHHYGHILLRKEEFNEYGNIIKTIEYKDGRPYRYFTHYPNEGLKYYDADNNLLTVDEYMNLGIEVAEDNVETSSRLISMFDSSGEQLANDLLQNRSQRSQTEDSTPVLSQEENSHLHTLRSEDMNITYLSEEYQPSNIVEVEVFNENGKLHRRLRYHPGSYPENAYETTYYYYNENGLLHGVVKQNQDRETLYRALYEYNEQGDLTQIKYQYKDGEIQSLEPFEAPEEVQEAAQQASEENDRQNAQETN